MKCNKGLCMAVTLAMLFLPNTLNAQIKPGSTWNDTNGKAINAHGGQVVWADGYYYWIGETRATSVSCYRSTDLIKWTRLADALSPTGTKTDENKDIASGRNLERPKIAYCENTGKWVMWIHWENGSDYGQAKVAVAQSDHVYGPYTLVDVFRPNDRDSRDQTLFVDDDGKAYHICATDMNSNQSFIQLSDDYLSCTDVQSKSLLGDKYEAAAVWKVGDMYYGVFSGCTGWDPNEGKKAYTLDILGKWEHRRDPMYNYHYGENWCVDSDDRYCYHSQPTAVFKLHGRENCYIYMGDRWTTSNIAGSKYVWVPLSMRSGYPTGRYYDSWDLTVFDDMYRYKRLAFASTDLTAEGARLFDDGAEVVILEKRSNRIVSRPSATFMIMDDDDDANVVFILHATDDPSTFRLEQKSSGKYLESVYGTMRLNTEKEPDDSAYNQQLWYMEIEEDGYLHITNAADSKVFSLSGNTLYAKTPVFLNAYDETIAQSFSLYYDSYAHSNYTEADLFSRHYREQNRLLMEQQEAIKHAKEAIPGDVNGDKTVDINDVVAVINVMAGTAEYEHANVNGDTDEDGNPVIDINDVVAIINIMAGNTGN